MSFPFPLEYGTGLFSRLRSSLVIVGVLLVALCAGMIWLLGSRNPYTPAGYVGYLTRGAVFGKSIFYGTQRGPTSAGRSWLLDVTNVSVTPYTYTEDFTGEDAVLSKDNLKIAFRVHTVWRVDESRVPLFMERFSTTMSDRGHEKEPDAIVKVAYGNFIREPLRTFARDEVQQRNGLEVKDALIAIGDAVLARIRTYAADSPFTITSVVVGNVQYPAEVADAVSRKLAATQELQRKDTEIEIERKERTKREVQAQGIANAMQIIRGQLSGDVHPARGDRGAEGDGEFAQSHRRLHPGRADGRADYRHVPDRAIDRGRRYTIAVALMSASMMR